MIIFQEVISSTVNGGKYPIPLPNGAPLVSFDFHNDSPYNCTLNFGQDVGYQAAEYYIPPHGILLGVKPPAVGISVGKSFTGTIYLYVATPQGGGIVLAAAPALQFTALGYQQGMAPAATVTMSRLQNQGNSSQVGNMTTNIVNDGATAGASLIEATVAGDTHGSAVTLANNAQQVLGNLTYPGSLDITNPAGDHSYITGDGIGIPSAPHLFLDTRTDTTYLGGFSAAGGVALGGNGTPFADVNQNGIQLLAGTLALLAGSISRLSTFSGAATTTPTFFNHGLGTVPDLVLIQRVGTSSAVETFGYDDTTMTTTQVKIVSNGSFNFRALAIKL